MDPKDDLVIGAISTDETSSAETPTTTKIKSTETTDSSITFSAMDVPPPPLFTHLSPNIKPVATKSRRQSPPDQKFINEEVRKLHRAGVVRPSVSPWRAQPFVTREDDNHRKRLVIDYSETINLFTELDAYPMPNVQKMIQDISQYKYYSTFDLKSAYHQIPIRDEDSTYTAFEADGQLWEFTRVPFGVTNGVSAFQRTIDKVFKTEGLCDTFTFVDNVTICGRTKEEHDQNCPLYHFHHYSRLHSQSEQHFSRQGAT